MTESETLSNFTINAAAATGKFRVKPHLGQSICRQDLLPFQLIVQIIVRFRLSTGEGR